MRNKGRSETSRLTLLGRVFLNRLRYHDPAGGSEVPIDLLVDKAQELVSLGVVELLCHLGIDSASFARATKNLGRTTGLLISEELLRRLVEREGKLVQRARHGEQLELDFKAVECTTNAGPCAGAAEEGKGSTATPGTGKTTRVYVGMDGFMVPLVTQAEKDKRRKKAKERRKRLQRRPNGPKLRPLPTAKAGADQRYKEFKTVNLYDQDQKHRYVETTAGDCNAAGKVLARMACEVRLRAAAEKIAVSDGAEWIWKQFDRRVPYLDAKVLDFYHLAEHVHEARRLIFGSEDAAGKAWAERALDAVRHGGYEPFWAMLVELRVQLAVNASRLEAADALMTYVAERRALMDYPRCERMGWDVGSGSTESMCGAMNHRLKLRGMRWDRDNAQAMAALESLEQMDAWPVWIKTRVASQN